MLIIIIWLILKERIEENDKETREGQYQTLLKNLNKLLQELVFITGKHVAAEEMQTKISKDSIYIRNLKIMEIFFMT